MQSGLLTVPARGAYLVDFRGLRHLKLAGHPPPRLSSIAVNAPIKSF